MITLPLPQGASLPPLHSSENYHICPHFMSLPTCSLLHFKHFGFTQLLLALSFYYPLIFTSCERKKKDTQNHASDQKCVTHSTTPECTSEFTQVQFTPKIRSLSKIKPVQQLKSIDKQQQKVPLALILFPPISQRRCCWANSLQRLKSCTPTFNFIFRPWEVKS